MMRKSEASFHGFDLGAVSWGYREKFKAVIDRLSAEGFLGGRTPETTRLFFAFLREHAGSSSEEVIHAFLQALDSGYTWILKNPRLFKRWCSTGRRLARKKLFAGIAFFRASAAGNLGVAPAETEAALTYIDALAEEKIELAFGLIGNFRNLCRRLTRRQLDRFVEEAERVYASSPRAGVDFIAGRLESAEAYLRRLTAEARLQDAAAAVRRLVKGISGRDVEVEDLGRLDSDELILRGSRVVGMARGLYLPGRVTEFGSPASNRRYYTLAGLVAGGCYLFRGFASRHGEDGYENLEKFLLGAGIPRRERERAAVLFELCEYARIFTALRETFPGAARLLLWGAKAEFEVVPPRSEADLVLLALTGGGVPPLGMEALVEAVRRTAAAAASFIETAGAVARLLRNGDAVRLRLPPLLRRTGFFPDPLFNAEVSPPAPEAVAADLSGTVHAGGKAEGDAGDASRRTGERKGAAARAGGEETGGEEDRAEGGGFRAAFVYDEWNGLRGEYYRNWCFLRERRPEARAEEDASPPPGGDAERIRRVFEYVQARTNRREKRLPDGDAINIDRLIEYITMRMARIQGKENFYERNLLSRRSVAAALLIDVSGSTGGEVGDRTRILDVEKAAAALLAEGLCLLGDEFAVYGFTGNGRENCEFFVFKEFDEEWDGDARRRLRSVYPGTSTRIGVALRHAGRKMDEVDARRKIILLITDGRPMDSEYDPNTGYAYDDVRKACAENKERGIDTFGIITDAGNRDEVHRMFPANRFFVVRDVRDLPGKLARFFLRVTV